MVRFGLVGDSHCHEHSRFEEHDRVMRFVADDAAERRCDIVLHSGDVWEKTSTPKERIAVSDWVSAVTEHAPLVVVAGNHDCSLDIDWIGRLEGTNYPVLAATQPEVLYVAGVAIACLPWPRISNLAAVTGITDREALDLSAREALRNVLRYLGSQMAEWAGPKVFLGHCMMRGSKVSNSQPPLVGAALEIGLEDLHLVGADFYGLGHIHLGAGNEWLVDGRAPAVFPGSPRRVNFGELEPKGYVVGELSDGRCEWQRVETPCTPMLAIHAAWADAQFIVADPQNVGGAEAKLRYTVRASEREAGALAAEEYRLAMLAQGAISVVVESEVIVEQRARAPEVSRATTLPTKLEALWESKGFDPGDRRAPLLAKLSDLESNTR